MLGAAECCHSDRMRMTCCGREERERPGSPLASTGHRSWVDVVGVAVVVLVVVGWEDVVADRR